VDDAAATVAGGTSHRVTPDAVSSARLSPGVKRSRVTETTPGDNDAAVRVRGQLEPLGRLLWQVRRRTCAVGRSAT
jgi:hypothetical protein